MKVEVKKISRKSNAENSKSLNQPTHVKNQNDEHNARKVSLGPNTNRLNLCSDFTSSNFLEKPSKRGDTKLEAAGHVCSFGAKSTPLGGASLQIDF
jgi:hypothetical protein